MDMEMVEKVNRPYQYSGGEYGVPNMDKQCDVRYCLCVPDSYDVGMSNLGTRILYYLFNKQEGIVCERCYAPWQDYADYIKSKGIKLSSLETKKPLLDFDFVGFSFQYELGYSNFFYMLDLAGIPYKYEDRGENYPFIVCGGPCTVNIEPMYEYFDFVFVGEGETPWPKILADYRKMKGSVTKKEFLQYVNDTYECIYVPSLYSVLYDKDRLVSINTTRKTIKNKERNLNESFYPDTQLVPSFEIIHDRAVMELFRGCANGCRFCQAGFIYRPVREKCPDDVYDRCVKLLENTGYGELSLNSLSTGDYSGLMPLLNKLNPYAKEHNIALNLPSLRLDSFEGEYADGNRKSSLTFAPEAGTQRLRDVINKNISEEDILGSLSKAFAEGYSSVKLYFMIGLPTETMEDIEGIVELAIKIRSLYFTVCTAKKDLRISISASTFIPKPFTPFQWAKFATREEIKEKQEYLVTKLKTRHITFSYHDYETSELEAILARGGRSLAPVLLRAYQLGAKFDAWSEHFHYEYYKQAFAEFNTNIDYIVGEKTYEQALPWDITDIGVTKEYLASENEKSKKAISTPSCTKQCNNCGLASYGWCKSTHGNKAR